MNVREALRAGGREILANKFRSILSFAAVSVGVASLLYSVAQTRGMQQQLEKNLEIMGPGRLEIKPKRDYQSKGLSPGMTRDDAWAIKREMPELYMVYPLSQRWGTRGLIGSKIMNDMRVFGVTPEWRKRDWVYKLRGRFLNDYDVRQQARVAVMIEPAGWLKKPFWASYWKDENPYDEYAKRHDLLGKQVRLEDSWFTVVGVLTPPYKDLDPRWDWWGTPHALVPVTSFGQRLNYQGNRPEIIGSIIVDTGDEKSLPLVKRRIQQLLLRRHRGEEDFEIQDEREEMQQRMERMQKYVMAGWALGVVALLAGGIGIMNVTLAAIFSRVREIGIRRAVGAGRADIMAQFVLEAAMLGAAGGLAGTALGIGGIELFVKSNNPEVAAVTPLHAAMAVAVGALVSAAFAFGPAWQASRLDPVEALKAE